MSVLAVLGSAATACSQNTDDGAQARQSRQPTAEDSSASDDSDPGSSDPTAGTDECDVIGGSSGTPVTNSVQVALTEYAIVPQPQEVPSGITEFVAVNGGRIWHELIIVRLDGDSGALPLDAFGGADETRFPEGAVVGKVREFVAGQTCRAAFDLTPGTYALICNLVDDGSNPHYSQGMHTSLSVT